ncbi:MAG: ABC transporter substrate-binding protein [Mycobacterium sp.]
MKHATTTLWKLVLAGLAAVLVFVLSGCGGGDANDSGSSASEGLTPVTFQLNSPAAGYNSGFELALVNGYYKDAGLDVKIEPGNGSANTAQLVAAGQIDIAYADSAAVMGLVKDGAKITVVSTILQSNPNQVTALAKSGITSIDQIKGKKVAVPNGYSQAAMFPLVLKSIGLTASDIDEVNMPAESMVASLLQGQVDVILGSIDNFGVQLKQQGADTVDFPFSDHGAATVSTSIIASDSFLAKNPEAVRAFVSASLKGWSAAIDDNDAALAAMSKVFPDATAELGQGQLDATEVLMCANGAKFIGKASPEQWATTVENLAAIGTLPTDKPATDYYSLDYVPKESELRACPIS